MIYELENTSSNENEVLEENITFVESLKSGPPFEMV